MINPVSDLDSEASMFKDFKAHTHETDRRTARLCRALFSGHNSPVSILQF